MQSWMKEWIQPIESVQMQQFTNELRSCEPLKCCPQMLSWLSLSWSTLSGKAPLCSPTPSCFQKSTSRARDSFCVIWIGFRQICTDRPVDGLRPRLMQDLLTGLLTRLLTGSPELQQARDMQPATVRKSQRRIRTCLTCGLVNEQACLETSSSCGTSAPAMVAPRWLLSRPAAAGRSANDPCSYPAGEH